MDGLNAAVRFRTREYSDPDLTTLGEISDEALIEAAPIRTPPNRPNQKHYPGMFWFSSSSRTLVYESLLERDRLWTADFDAGIEAAATQPFHITGTDGSRMRRHVPDMFFRHSDGSHTLVDVKPAYQLDRREVQEQFAWTGQLCAKKGWNYQVWSGEEPTFLRNVRYVSLGRRALQLHKDLVQEVSVYGQPGMTLGEAKNAAGRRFPMEDVRIAALALIWSHKWRTNLTLPLSDQSKLIPEDV